VREYWIVDPAAKYIHIYSMDNKGKYPEDPKILFPGDTAACTVLEGLQIDVTEVFAED
jgi:Uma2 family endonuclease